VTGRILYVNLGKDYVDLYLEGMEGKHYFRVRNHEDLPTWYVVEEHLADWVINADSNPYKTLGVDDLRGLVEKLSRELQPTLARLTGVRIRIEKVVVR
jgi:hypothetical protein